MDVPGEFYLYAAVYRLAIIAAGALAILLGFRLFLHGVERSDGKGGGTDASAEAGGFKFTIGNAAPGTCFALFGAALIVAMAFDGNPEYFHKRGDEEIRLKSMQGQIGDAATNAAPAFAGGDLESYRRMLAQPGAPASDIADAIAGVAGLYLAETRSVEALTLARLAVQIDGADPEKLDLLAAAAQANALTGEAAAAQAQAAALRHAGR